MFGPGKILGKFIRSLPRKGPQETVTEIRDGGAVVVTDLDGSTITYYGCIERYAIGQTLEKPPKHRSRTYRLRWTGLDTEED